MGSNLKPGVRSVLNAHSRQVIFNVHHYFTEEAIRFKLSHNRYFNAIQNRCAQALGISKTSLNRLLSERFQVPSSGRRIRKIKSPKGKSHVRFCDMVNKVFIYISMECEKFKSAENGYFEDVEERAVNATGICRSLLLKLLNGKENGSSELISAKLYSLKETYYNGDVGDLKPTEISSTFASVFGSSKCKSAKLDSPKIKSDSEADISPIEISSSESDCEIEVSDTEGFSVSDYVLT